MNDQQPENIPQGSTPGGNTSGSSADVNANPAAAGPVVTDHTGSVPPVGDIAPKPPLQPAVSSAFATKLPSTLALSIALLMFLLPFIELRCNNMPFAKFSGVQLATGFKIDMPGSDNTITGRLTDLSDGVTQKKNDGNIYAIAALVLTVISLGLAFVNMRAGIAGALVTAALAVVSLIALMINVKNQVSGEMSKDEDVVISVNFAAGFYLALIALIAGIYFCYRRLPFVRSASYSMLKSAT